jgi:hypothetical protein
MSDPDSSESEDPSPSLWVTWSGSGVSGGSGVAWVVVRVGPIGPIGPLLLPPLPVALVVVGLIEGMSSGGLTCPGFTVGFGGVRGAAG